jgi:hypothetical protein
MTGVSPKTASPGSIVGLAIVAALVGLAAADPADFPVPSDPIFTALERDGKTVEGRIRRIGPHGEITLVPTEGAEQTVPYDRLLKLTREGLLPPLSPEAPLVLFPGGDRLYRGVIGPASETHLEVQSYTLGNLSIPLESLLGLVLKGPKEADQLDDLIDRLRNEPRESEVVWLTNGDRVRGGLLALDEKALKFQAPSGPITLELSNVRALGFDPKLAVYRKPEGDYFELTASDGSRLGATGVRIEQGSLVGTSLFGTPIKLGLGDLVKLHARSPSILYLSDRDADAVQYVSYVGPARPYRRDSTVDHHPIRLGGQSYDRGLGTQSRTLLAYRLEPGARRFQALVGLDDRAGPLGNVVFRVVVDREERFVSPPMSVRDTPRAIDLDVTGATRIILITEFGERGGVRDLADWAEARVLR